MVTFSSSPYPEKVLQAEQENDQGASVPGHPLLCRSGPGSWKLPEGDTGAFSVSASHSPRRCGTQCFSLKHLILLETKVLQGRRL